MQSNGAHPERNSDFDRTANKNIGEGGQTANGELIKMHKKSLQQS